LVFPTDATSNAVGFAGTAWAQDATANTNPASLAHTSGFQVAAAVRNRFLVEGLYDYGLFGSFELGSAGTVGIQVEHFGFEAFRQQTFGASFGRKLSEKWSIGVRFNYLIISQELQENASSLYGTLGLLYHINDELVLGAEISLISKSVEGLLLPTAQKFGFSYAPSDIVSVNAELGFYDDTDQHWSAGVGITYDIFDTVGLALGYRSNPDSFSFGIGWQVSEGLMINLSSSFHQRLGASPIGGFVYRQ